MLTSPALGRWDDLHGTETYVMAGAEGWGYLSVAFDWMFCPECGDRCGPGPIVDSRAELDAELKRLAVEGDELSLRISLAQRALDGRLPTGDDQP